MSLNSYISKVVGEKQGAFKGGAIQKGAEPAPAAPAKAPVKAKDAKPVDAFEVSSPRDAASGLPTGKRTHKPIRF